MTCMEDWGIGLNSPGDGHDGITRESTWPHLSPSQPLDFTKKRAKLTALYVHYPF